MTPPWKWPKNCSRSSRRARATSARPGSTATMRKPAAWPKPFALMVSARLGGFRAALKVLVRSWRYILAVYLAFGERERGADAPFPAPPISAWWAGRAQACLPLCWNAYREGFDAAHETGIHPLRLAHHLDPVKALEHLLPHDLQLQLGEPHADAAMNAEPKRQMGAGPGAIDDKVVRVLDTLFVAIARDVPHHDPVALADFLAAEFGIDQRRTPHMRQRRLPANDFGHHGVDQRRIVAQLLVLVGVFVQRQHRAAHGVAGSVIAADDQQDDVAHQIVGVHVPGGFAVRHHRDQIEIG